MLVWLVCAPAYTVNSWVGARRTLRSKDKVVDQVCGPDLRERLPRGIAARTQVVLRSSARAQGLPDLGRNERRLEQLRRRLGWEPVSGLQ